MEQAQRIAEFDRFKSGEITILVASDVAARGLDVKGVSHVINYDVPWQPDDYIHRIGRTGRAGMSGIAITLATRSDAEAVAGIEKLIGHKIPRQGAAANAAARAEAPKASKPSKPTTAEPAPQASKPPKAETAEPAPKVEKPEPARKSEKPARAAKKPQPTERSPVVEDMEDEWNGPVPSFLSFGAD
jgi:superfamily II DNA/RNA helicase